MDEDPCHAIEGGQTLGQVQIYSQNAEEETFLGLAGWNEAERMKSNVQKAPVLAGG